MEKKEIITAICYDCGHEIEATLVHDEYVYHVEPCENCLRKAYDRGFAGKQFFNEEEL